MVMIVFFDYTIFFFDYTIFFYNDDYYSV